MTTFHIISLFPEAFKSIFSVSIIKRAQDKKLIRIEFHNPRDFAKDKHKTAAPACATRKRCGRVDDKSYGGGPGMVMKIEPIVWTIGSISKSKAKNKKLKVILLSPSGKQFNQVMARNLAKKCNSIVLICGHYEGIDERLKKVLQDSGFKIQELSIGPYILSGGEIAAMVVVDAISRHIPGVVGKIESLEENKGSYPAYTRPEILSFKDKKYAVPKVLLSGNRKKISEWRTKHGKMK